jgi:hypothetical protein
LPAKHAKSAKKKKLRSPLGNVAQPAQPAAYKVVSLRVFRVIGGPNGVFVRD